MHVFPLRIMHRALKASWFVLFERNKIKILFKVKIIRTQFSSSVTFVKHLKRLDWLLIDYSKSCILYLKRLSETEDANVNGVLLLSISYMELYEFISYLICYIYYSCISRIICIILAATTTSIHLRYQMVKHLYRIIYTLILNQVYLKIVC